MIYPQHHQNHEKKIDSERLFTLSIYSARSGLDGVSGEQRETIGMAPGLVDVRSPSSLRFLSVDILEAAFIVLLCQLKRR